MLKQMYEQHSTSADGITHTHTYVLLYDECTNALDDL